MKLQIALDLVNLNEAIRIARRALEGGADIIEAGTPLIKFYGVKAIERLRKAFPHTTIVADMKTIDAGALEAEIAFQAGADIVTVLGVASDRTVSEVIRMAREYGGKVMADLMRVQDKPKRALELESLGVDYILVHTGIDEQTLGKRPIDDLIAVEQNTVIPLAVAGGITDKEIDSIKKFRVEIVIVGRYVTKAADPKEAVRRLIAKLREV